MLLRTECRLRHYGSAATSRQCFKCRNSFAFLIHFLAPLLRLLQSTVRPTGRWTLPPLSGYGTAHLHPDSCINHSYRSLWEARPRAHSCSCWSNEGWTTWYGSANRLRESVRVDILRTYAQLQAIRQRAEVVKRLPFSSEAKLAATFVASTHGNVRALCTGAPDVIVPRCTFFLRTDGTVRLASLAALSHLRGGPT